MFFFNKPVNFNTERVTNMSYVFHNCRYFNQKVNFNTENVKNMRNIFNGYKYCNNIKFIFNKCNNLEIKNIINKNYSYKIKYCWKCNKLK